jgi:hypothetical protein
LNVTGGVFLPAVEAVIHAAVRQTVGFADCNFRIIRGKNSGEVAPFDCLKKSADNF